MNELNLKRLEFDQSALDVDVVINSPVRKETLLGEDYSRSEFMSEMNRSSMLMAEGKFMTKMETLISVK